MSEMTIKSGPQIVKDFVEALKNDDTLDQATVEVIVPLYSDKKITQTRLQQGLASKRKV